MGKRVTYFGDCKSPRFCPSGWHIRWNWDKFLFCLTFVFCCLSSYSQRQGFFNIYEQAEKSFCASSVIETDDDCLIVGLYDYYGGSGELVKMTKHGEVLKRLLLNEEGVFSGIEGLYRDSSQPDRFVGIGSVWYRDAQVEKPFVMHFDEDLNLLYRKEVDLPGEYHNFVMMRSLLTQDGDFIYAASLDAQNDYHRLYMRIALDGTLERFYEETEGCGLPIVINAIFEFPEGNYFGDYRISFKYQGYNALQQRLFGFDDDFVFDTIHEYEQIVQPLNNDTTYRILIKTSANGTVMPLNDSILLFSDKVKETWYQNMSGTIYCTDFSTLLSSADLEGNVINYLVIGSCNDTTEVPVAFNSIDIAKDESNEDVFIYHGCCGEMPVYQTPLPNNITLTKTDENLNVVWQKNYTHPTRFLQATCLIATHDGGCLVAGGAFDDLNSHYDLFVLKIDADGNVGMDEIAVTDRVIVYPNPVYETVRIEGVEVAEVQFYNDLGQLVKTAKKTNEINVSGLVEGVYLLRITDVDGRSHTARVAVKQ